MAAMLSNSVHAMLTLCSSSGSSHRNRSSGVLTAQSLVLDFLGGSGGVGGLDGVT